MNPSGDHLETRETVQVANRGDGDPDASRLFRDQVGDVRPVKQDRIAPAQRRPAPVPRQARLDERRVMDELRSGGFELQDLELDLETGEELSFCRAGVQQGVLRKLRKARFSVQGELDLHGMTVPQARKALVDFLAECATRDLRCVRIIHGKGHGSLRREPVLKRKVGGWLRQLNSVLAYCSAQQADGGTGALYVLLKRGS